jgi:hypothetical protein
MTALLADFVITLLPTFVVSRLLLWLTKTWSGSVVRLIVVHLASLVLCASLALFLEAGGWLAVEGVSGQPLAALALFTPGQLAWLLVDAFGLARRRRRGGE